MKIRLNDLTMIMSGTDKELNAVRKAITWEDTSNCFSGGIWHPERKKSVCLAKDIKGYLVCFAGLAKEIILFAKNNGIKIEDFEDNRTHFPFQKKQWSHDELRKFFNPNFDYVEHQIRALQGLLSTNAALVVAATSAGKSTVMAAMIRLTKLPTLILVNKVTLGMQLRDTFREEGIDCGICSGKGVIKGECMVSTIQSIKKIGDLTRYKMVLCDECFPGNTPILTENGYKLISTLVNNKSTEKVWSFNKETKEIELMPISNWMKKETEYDNFIKVYFDNSNVISTPNHKYYILKNNNIEMVRADELKTGDKVITYDNYKVITKIESIELEDKVVYNITVNKNHNYFVGFENCLVSNCHNASSSQFQEFLSQYGCPLKYGFSASPFRNGDFLGYAKIRQFLGSPVVDIKGTELIENKVMAKPTIYIVKNEGSDNEYFDYQSAYSEEIVNSKRRNQKAVDICNKYKEGVLILVNILEHGKILEEMIPGSVFIAGETPVDDRARIIKQFDNEEIPILIASTILQEGVSITHMKAMVLCCGGKSNIAILQKIGRSLRFKKGEKETVDYYDFYDKVKFLSKHSKMRIDLYKKAGYDDIHVLDENLEEIKKETKK